MTTSISDTPGFRDVCRSVDLETFKTNPTILTIFEHVSIPFGQQYADLILAQYPELAALAPDFQVNDLVGGGTDRILINGVELSPSTLRYVKVAGDLLASWSQFPRSIVEIGAGYGGQCLILDTFFKKTKPRYAIYDLPEVAELQKRYLGAHKLENVVWKGAENNVEYFDFCISNYAFSECTIEQQDWYLRNVIDRSRSGYMVCNFISQNFGIRSHALNALLHRIPGSWAEADTPHAYETVIVRW